MRKIFLLAVLFGIVSLLFGQERSDLMREYAETITRAELEENLHEFASDKFEGRETGKKGQKLAMEFLVGQLKEKGISGFTDGTNSTYIQEYPLYLSLRKNYSLSIDQKKSEFLKDFYYFSPLTDKYLKTSEVEFLGFGIDDKKYSDYAIPKNRRGKFVLVLSGEPSKKGKVYLTGKNEVSAWGKSIRKKIERAKQAGIKVLLIADDNFSDNAKKSKHYLKKEVMFLTERSNQETKVIFISNQQANSIIKSSGKTVEKIRKKIGKKKRTIGFTTQIDFLLAREEKPKQIKAENVVGFIQGSDKNLREEVIVISAHYDHIGMEGEEVFNGADDDGSGTIAILEIGEAFARAKADGYGPKRSILILAVSGEEKGLLGSRYYTDNPLIPMENTVANLNIDMIGRTDKEHEGKPNYVYSIGSDRQSSQLREISEEIASRYSKIKLDYTYDDRDDPNRFFYRSDHYNFARNKVPVIFYFSGIHQDYHKPTDTSDKIDFDKLQKTTQLIFCTAWRLANMEGKLKKD